MSTSSQESHPSRSRFITMLLLGMAAAFASAILLVNFLLLPWHVKVGREVAVPDVRGMTREDAEARLQSKGFAIGDVRYVTDTAPFGRVVDTRPRSGMMVKAGRAIGLDVSGGQEKTLVPQVYRLPLRRAQAAIENAGLRVGEIAIVPAARVPEGLIISAHPAPGLRVLKGTAVNLTVSGGGGEIVEMPKLKGLTIDKARDILTNLRLILMEPKTVNSPEPAGTVLEQDPEEGTEILVGDTVRLKIAGTPKATRSAAKVLPAKPSGSASDSITKTGRSQKPKSRITSRRKTG